MNQQEHLQEARELMDWSQEVTESGRNPRIAAELLWGSFAHCLITVALNDGLPHDSHGAFRNIARHLDTGQSNNRWTSNFGAAERLHQHFYHGDLTEDLLRSHRQATLNGTIELLRTL